MRRAAVLVLLVLACGKEPPPAAPARPAPPDLPAKTQPAESAAPTPNRLPPVNRDLAAIGESGELAFEKATAAEPARA